MSSVGRASDFRSQSCGFESHCEQEFCILVVTTRSWQVDWGRTNEIKHAIHPTYMKVHRENDHLKDKRPKGPHRAPEYNVPASWQIGQGGHFCLLIGLKNINSVEDVEILLPIKFHWILFRGEVENISANQRPGQSSCFSDRPEKHKLGRGRWDLASCQVSLKYVQQFQRRSQKCL